MRYFRSGGMAGFGSQRRPDLLTYCSQGQPFISAGLLRKHCPQRMFNDEKLFRDWLGFWCQPAALNRPGPRLCLYKLLQENKMALACFYKLQGERFHISLQLDSYFLTLTVGRVFLALQTNVNWSQYNNMKNPIMSALKNGIHWHQHA